MRKSLLSFLALLLAFAVVASACGSDDNKDASPDTGDQSSGLPDKFPDTVEPVKGGTLTMAISADSNIDCYNGLSYYGIGWSLFYFMARGLYGLPDTVESPETDTLRPDLAADMPEISDDGLTYTVKLREGLTFPDGSPVTAADVKGTYEYMLDPNTQCSSGGPPASGYYSVIEGATAYNEAKAADPAAAVEITGIKAVDDLTTTFTLTQPDGAFIQALGMAWSFIRPADTKHELLEEPPPFVGPYTITDFTIDQKVVVGRQDSWADNVAAGVPEEADQNNIDGIELSIGVTDETQLGEIKNNTLDLSYDGGAPTGSDIPAVANDSAYDGRFFSSADASLDYGFFRTDKPPFDDVKLRQAVNYAIDRENITTILGGELNRSPWSELLPANMMAGSDDADGTAYTVDAQKAKDLIEESGATTPIDITLVHYADEPAPQVAASIKENLDAVGFNVTLEPQSADVIQGFLSEQESDYDLAFIAWGQDYSDAITFFGPLLGCPGGEPTGQNYGRFCDEEFQSSLEEIAKLPAGQERTDEFAQLSIDTTKDKAPWFTLTNRRKVNFVSERVGNFIWGPAKQLYFGHYFLKDS